MDQLNYFMRERALPKQLRQDLRKYFETARQVREITDDANLLEQMSPLMQGRVAFSAHCKWLERIWYFARLADTRDSRDFIAVVAKSLGVRAYISEERTPIGQLCEHLRIRTRDPNPRAALVHSLLTSVSPNLYSRRRAAQGRMRQELALYARGRRVGRRYDHRRATLARPLPSCEQRTLNLTLITLSQARFSQVPAFSLAHFHSLCSRPAFDLLLLSRSQSPTWKVRFARAANSCLFPCSAVPCACSVVRAAHPPLRSAQRTLYSTSTPHIASHRLAHLVAPHTVFVLTREALDAAAEGFPEATATIVRAARRIRLQRALLCYFCEIQGKQPRSFVRRRDSNHVQFVSSQMTIEQKIEELHSSFVENGELNLSRSRRRPNASAASEAAKLFLNLRGIGTAGSAGLNEQDNQAKSLSQILHMSRANFTARDSEEIDTTSLSLEDARPLPQASGPSTGHAKDNSGGGSAGGHDTWFARMTPSQRGESDGRDGGGGGEAVKRLESSVRAIGARVGAMDATVHAALTAVSGLCAQVEQQSAVLARLDKHLAGLGAGVGGAAGGSGLSPKTTSPKDAKLAGPKKSPKGAGAGGRTGAVAL